LGLTALPSCDAPGGRACYRPATFQAARKEVFVPTGLKIASPYFLEPGTTVKVRLHHTIFFGEVRHCRMINGAYHSGIELENVFQI
jgi:hypothetical protein